VKRINLVVITLLGIQAVPIEAQELSNPGDLEFARSINVCITHLEASREGDRGYLNRYKAQKDLGDETFSALLRTCRAFLQGATYGFDNANRISGTKWKAHIREEHSPVTSDVDCYMDGTCEPNDNAIGVAERPPSASGKASTVGASQGASSQEPPK
jgi:hypothetical protein